MNKKAFLKTVLAGFLLAGLSLTTSGQDFPGWRGENRDGKVSGFEAPDNWPESLKKVWTVEVGEGDASPVLMNEKIYLHTMVDSNEVLSCIDANNGKEVWSTVLNPSPKITGGAASHPGPRSTPCISGGKIYTLGAGGIVHCLNSKTGKVIWKDQKYTEVPQFFTSCSPLVVDDLCILHLGGKESGVVVAYNKDSGKEVWKNKGIPSTYSSPVMMDTYEGLILVQSETDLLGISMGGEGLWKIPTPGERRFYNSTSPVYKDNTLIICGQGIGTKAYKLTKTGADWDTVLLWHNAELGTSFNTPIVRNGFIFGNEARMGYLYSINLKTGETEWQNDVPLNRFASMLDLGDVLVSLSGKGQMVFFEPDGEKYGELATYSVSDNEVYAHPIIAGNQIYVKDKNHLTCWKIE